MSSGSNDALAKLKGRSTQKDKDGKPGCRSTPI
jgi:hypothetical protein